MRFCAQNTNLLYELSVQDELACLPHLRPFQTCSLWHSSTVSSLVDQLHTGPYDSTDPHTAGHSKRIRTVVRLRTAPYYYGSVLISNFAPLISEVEVDALVPWKPHKAISFRIKSAPKEIKIRRLKVAKRFLYEKGEKGNVLQWEIDNEDCERIHDTKKEEARDAIRDYADEIGITEDAVELAVAYAQWSLATEEAIIRKVVVSGFYVCCLAVKGGNMLALRESLVDSVC